MKPSNQISDLVDLMAALRTPVTGCPWDLEQDFSTIAPYTIEEAYEVADAIERKDWEDLRDELGDLLLQPIYHARMAEEAGLFDFADVILSISTKMIRRHPHVFGDEQARTAGLAKGAWEKMKAAEKAGKSDDSDKTENLNKGLLHDIPGNLPALQTARKLQKKAATVGFDWENAAEVVGKMKEEISELEQAISQGSWEEQRDEIGDLLFTVSNIARHLGIEPDNALRHTNHKFRTRFSHVEQQVSQKGGNLKDASAEEMEEHWQEAKALDGAK